MNITDQVTKIDVKPESAYDFVTIIQVYGYDSVEEHEQSGTLVLDLPTISPGDRFAPLPVAVAGVRFSGLLGNWSGVEVLESSDRLNATTGQWETASTGERGFILDLGGMWSVLELRVRNAVAKITCVVPWLGTDFAPGSVYPPTTGYYPVRTPDPTGTEQASLHGVQSQKLYVQFSKGLTVGQLRDNLLVVSAVYPRSLRAQLEGKEVFWTYPGELRGETLITGLSESLNILAAEISTPATPKLVISTDAPGVIVAPEDLADKLVAEKGTEAAWAGEPGTTVEIRAGEQIGLPFIFGDDGSEANWLGRSLRVTGRYDASPWRIEALESGETLAAPMGLKVDAAFAAGRRFTVSRDLELHGVSLPLAGVAAGELLLELLPDENGRPGADALASADLVIAADSAGAWREALFPEPLPLAIDQGFWVVLKAREGGARWLAVAAEVSDSVHSEEGGTWAAFPTVFKGPDQATLLPQAMLRLLRSPWPEESGALLTLSVPGKSGTLALAWNRRMEDEPLEWQLLDADPPEFPPPAPGQGRTWPATITSPAGGTLHIELAELFYELRP